MVLLSGVAVEFHKPNHDDVDAVCRRVLDCVGVALGGTVRSGMACEGVLGAGSAAEVSGAGISPSVGALGWFGSVDTGGLWGLDWSVGPMMACDSVNGVRAHQPSHPDEVEGRCGVAGGSVFAGGAVAVESVASSVDISTSGLVSSTE